MSAWATPTIVDGRYQLTVSPVIFQRGILRAESDEALTVRCEALGVTATSRDEMIAAIMERCDRA